VTAYAMGAACIAALVLWHAGDPRLGAYVLAGCVATLAVAGGLTWVCLRLLNAVSSAGAGVSWRYGIASFAPAPSRNRLAGRCLVAGTDGSSHPDADSF